MSLRQYAKSTYLSFLPSRLASFPAVNVAGYETTSRLRMMRMIGYSNNAKFVEALKWQYQKPMVEMRIRITLWRKLNVHPSATCYIT